MDPIGLSQVALAEHDAARAFAFLDDMWEYGIKPRSLFDIERREVTAEAYWMAGRRTDALDELLEVSRIYRGNALCHYRRGRFLEEMGRAADARKEYETFLTMWSHADEDLPQLLDARTRLAGLK